MSHHVTALRPRNGRLIIIRQGHKTFRTRFRAMPLTMFHMPPRFELLNGVAIVQTRNVIDRFSAFAEIPLHHLLILVVVVGSVELHLHLLRRSRGFGEWCVVGGERRERESEVVGGEEEEGDGDEESGEEYNDDLLYGDRH